ncbi:MAG TPA: peptidoglycan-binding protein [Sporolactobacillaceae bacterium]|nr:peptidoglycan-binding protein [Sporolactobacillaceae bacterium]
MIIKQLTKKVIVTSVMAGSLFVLPQLVSPHHASAATVSINTTHQVLHEGNVGRSVRAVQTKLKELGYYHDTIDGDYGPHTRSAVMGYQRAHHLVVDGIAGPHTLGELFGTSASVRTTSTSTVSHSTASHSVKSLQTRLRSLGYYHDSIDGINGPHTHSAVRAFQSRNGLAVDGIAGPRTWAKLGSSSAQAASSSSVSTQSTNLRPVSTNASSSSLVGSIISEAKAEQGVPYRWGGTTPSGFDCSGFTSYVFAKNGINLPRTAAEQYAQGSPTSLVPGALVFFSTTTSGISHVGIYIGNNEFISSTTSHGVAIESMSNPYWGPRYRGARTYINNQN